MHINVGSAHCSATPLLAISILTYVHSIGYPPKSGIRERCDSLRFSEILARAHVHAQRYQRRRSFLRSFFSFLPFFSRRESHIQVTLSRSQSCRIDLSLRRMYAHFTCDFSARTSSRVGNQPRRALLFLSVFLPVYLWAAFVFSCYFFANFHLRVLGLIWFY
jgi:hypothetical protein